MSKPDPSTAVMDEEARQEEHVTLKDKFFHHWSAFMYCGLTSLGGFQLGLDLGAIAGFQAMPGFLQIFGFPSKASVSGYGINPTVQQLISSLMLIGAFVACLLIGPVGKLVSRKWLLFIGCCINHLAVILMMLATDLATLYAGRTIMGLSVGILDVLPQLYIHECAPAVQRGSLLGAFNVLVSVGLLIGSIVDNYTSTMMNKESYRIPLGLFFIFPVIISVLLPFMPETPRWLVEHNKVEKARKALVRLRNKATSPQLIEAELQEIVTAFETEKSLTQGSALLDCFRKTNLRRTLLALGLMTCLTGSGGVFILSYGTYFFQVAGQTNAFAEVVGMTAAGLAATLFSMWLITRIGRRTILMFGFATQAACMLIVATVDQFAGTNAAGGRALVAFTIIYLFFYNMCIAPYLYLCAGEIPTQRLRGYTLGMAIAVAFLWNWVASYTTPYFLNPLELNWGGKYGYIWFGSNIIILFFIFFALPETKDRTLEEIDEMFEEKVPARKFKNYNCARSEHARVIGMHIIEDKQSEGHNHVESLGN
ncbi:general substrate transporter [Exophiala viscosa]|uniref:General substrate transporter n=1 Tax=Exophiala viscosa TaxID=2486360 RepID=A0AAN6DLZ4_9EURO|nr:general substrate transporter [Exophiala viscosa]